MSESLNVVVVGGVACGPKTAARLLRLMPAARVTVVERGGLVSYGACGLPYYVEGEFDDIAELVQTPAGIARTPAFFEKAKGFAVRTRTEAVRIDRARKTVRVRDLDSGAEEDLAYDKLVLATGGEPVRPPIPGLDLGNVWHMTHPDHAASLVREIEAQGLQRAVLVGAGLINVEMAEALVARGLAVTLLEMAPQVLPGVLDRDLAGFVAKHLRQKGVEIVLGERAVALTGAGKVAAVATDARTLEADLVVVAVGTRPNTRLAEEAGLRCERGIVVDENGRTSDDDIYAGGDCVSNRYFDPAVGERFFVPLGSTANKHGRAIANHIAGRPTPFAGIACTGIVRAFDVSAGRTGLTEQQARGLGLDVEVVTWAGPDKPHYMSDAALLVIKMIARRDDRRLVGVQIAGPGDAAKRLDVAAAVLAHGGTLDSLAGIDFAYAPPFSPPIDPLAACAHLLSNKLDGIARSVSAAEALRRVAEGAVLVDTRTPEEFAELRLPVDVVHIPLGALRGRARELPRDREILTFCKVSMRGYEAQRILAGLGFPRVAFVEGGIAAWPAPPA